EPEVPTEVHTPPQEEPVLPLEEVLDATEELTPERRREVILQAAADGLSQRKVAERAACSPAYVRKVLDAAA
ncbi:helix-turn-helix domain-containing protein, partial [Kitasatospora purpeofusca]